MGFLNGLVNDMLKESTGYDVRKITRMVGGKNLLMLGAGAALAGGMAGGFGQGANDGPSTWAEPPRAGGGSPPPLPPLPGASPAQAAPPLPTPTAAPLPAAPEPAAPPPLPPTPAIAPPMEAPAADGIIAGSGQAAEEVAEEEVPISADLTYAIVRTMVSAALADGNMDEKEKATILDRLGSSGLDAERVQQVHRDLVIPPTPAELASLTESFSEREAMYRFAGLIVLSDGQVTDLERSWLDRLAVALGFDAERKGHLEGEIFAE